LALDVAIQTGASAFIVHQLFTCAQDMGDGQLIVVISTRRIQEPNKTLHPTATSILFVFQASISPRMS
jgi:hypothetical protein